jgi:hypothetical protein
MGPREGLYGRLAGEQDEKASTGVGGESGPQTGADGFGGVEIHYWDAEKTAEVARLLAQHPPRAAQFSTTTVGQPTD